MTTLRIMAAIFSMPGLWMLTSCGASQADTTTTPPSRETITQVTNPGYRVGVSHETEADTRGLGVAIDRAWPALVDVYAELEIPVSVYDSLTYRIGNLGFQPRRLGNQRLSRYLDCGEGVTAVPYADQYAVTLSLLTSLRAAGNGESVLLTELEATAKPRTVSGSALPCASRGTLEQLIVEMVQERAMTGG